MTVQKYKDTIEQKRSDACSKMLSMEPADPGYGVAMLKAAIWDDVYQLSKELNINRITFIKNKHGKWVQFNPWKTR